MTDYLIELFNTATAFAISFPLLLYPMWETRSVKNRFIFFYIIGFAVFMCASLFVARQFMVLDINTIQRFKLIFFPPQFILPFIAFPKRKWQVVFLIAMYLIYGPFFVGLGNRMAERYFPENQLLYSSLISNAIIAVTFPPLIIRLRRLYANPGVERATRFWQLAWLIPMSFQAFIIPQGTYVTGSDFGVWFVVIRISAYFISLLICWIFDVVARQISEAEDAKREVEAAKNEAAMLDRMNKLKTELMTTISHEARTPLAVLASYAGVVSVELRDKGLEMQTAANLDKIVFEAKRVAELIDSMNKMMLRGEGVPKRFVFGVGDVIRQTAELFRHLLENDGTEFEIHIGKDLPPVFGRPEELTQVLFNLLQNARKHTKAGQTIAVSAELFGKHIAVTVKDTGEGIAPELLPRVFERGVSGDGGTGLGLAICKEIIESHGGEITIDSGQLTMDNEKSGTTVTFTLPVHERRGGGGN